MAKIRILLSVVATLIMTIGVIFLILAMFSATYDRFLETEFRLQWSKSDPGYLWHFLSALCEWLGMLALDLYFATFIPEFVGIDWKYLRGTTLQKSDNLNKDEINGNQIP